MRITRLSAIRLFILAALLCAAASAQLSTSSITGTVRDTSGSVVPEAAVSLRNAGTGVERQSVTNEAGNALGRYPFRADWSKNVDLSIFRQFSIRESKALEFRAEAFNVFNNTVYNAPTADFNSPNFGKVLSIANSPRQLQLGAKIIF
jgi:hypothetical protein